MRQRLAAPVAFAVGGQELSLRDCAEADAPAVLGLHRRVFGTTVDAHWFDWKYRQGLGESVGVWRDQALVAHCGGVPRRLWHQARSYPGLQMADVMVDPLWRGLLTRSGPFYRVSQAFYSSRMGPPADSAQPGSLAGAPPFGPGFGFPNARHLRLGVKVGLMHDAGPVFGLVWPAAGAAAPAGGQLRALGLQGLQGTGAVWLRLASLAMRRRLHRLWSTDKSPEVLRWRYGQRPGVAHEVWLVRASARPWHWGVAITRGGRAEEPTLHWLDWIGPPALMPLALALLRSAAAARGGQDLSVWATAPVREALQMSAPPQVEEVARVAIAACSPLAGLARHDNGWWLMGGDTDFL